LDAALNVGDIEYKWELFVLMARLLKVQSRIEEARKHLLLAFKLMQDREVGVLKRECLQRMSSSPQCLSVYSGGSLFRKQS
jgi:hypothetical protein